MTVRWGFLGAGGIATAALAPAVHAAAGASLQAVAARDVERAAALGPAVAGTDYQELLDRDDVDAVYVALTNDMHLPWSVAAMRAGKAVLCEKPLALTASEVDTLAAVAAETGQLLVEASWYRWHPRIRLAQRRLDEVGQIRHVSAGFTFDGSLAGNYRLDPARGGGALYDVGCYAVSACLWALGHRLPAEVSARSELGPTGVDLVTEAILEWPDGATAEVRAGIAGSSGQWLVLTGEGGEIELRDAPYTSWKNDPTELIVSNGATTERLTLPPADAYQTMVEEMSAVLEGRPGWVLPLTQSRQTAAVLDAVRGSARTGRPVRPGPPDA